MKRHILTLLISIFCGTLYSQDSITVYQGANTQKFLLSEIDSITHSINNSVNIYHNSQKYGYSVTKVDSVSFMQANQLEKEGTATIIMNADDPKVVTLKKNSGEVLHFYGKKDDAGAVEYFTQMEYISTEGQMSLVEFYENGQIKSFAAPNDVTIDFEWINSEEAVIKVYNPEDNSYIITNWNIHGTANQARQLVPSKFVQRAGNFVMTQIPAISSIRRAPEESIEVQDERGYDVWIKKCESPTNAKVYIKIVDGQNHNNVITNIYNYQYVTQGWYSFHIPDWTFPTTMPNKELAKRIDDIINATLNGFSDCATNGSLILAINAALFASGVGVMPAIIADAIAYLAAMGASVLGAYDQVSWFAKNFYPDWYYLEEYKSIFVIPYVNGKAYPEEGYHVNFNDSDWGSTINLEGSPEIRSFDLSPKFPSAGQGYRASVFYRCIPKGSKIVMGIVGTDGYHDEKTQTVVAESGSANLDVPGAQTGVHDVCTVKIFDTNGQLIASTQASLTFGQ